MILTISYAFTITNVLVLFITLVFMLYVYFKRSYTYWSRRGVATPPCNFPLGNLNDVIFGRVSLQEMFKKVYTNFKFKGMKYFGYYLLHQPVLVVIDVELIKSIMVKDFSHFTDHGVFDKRDYDIFGNHLFSSKGDEWRTMREKLTPLFTSGKLKMMFPSIAHCSVQLTNLIDEAVESSKKLDMRDVAGRYTIDTIASVAFGIESNSLKDPVSEFKKYGELALGQASAWNALRLAAHSLVPALTAFFKVCVYPPDASNFFLKIVQSTINYREEKNIVRNDFMQLMIQLKNNIDISGNNNDCFQLKVNNINDSEMENKKNICSLSIEQIAAQTILFFTAGYDTSSGTIAFCMYELAFQQNIQDKLREEINAVLKKQNGKLSYNAIMEMTYMDKCIKETLRKYPFVPHLFRQCNKTFQVPNSDFLIEKDMLIYIPVNELHYDPEYYPNPEKFEPERFSSENISKMNTFTWLPFGEGPRICIGQRLGMMQVKVALTTLLRNFRYTIDPKTVYPLKTAPRSILLTAEGGICLNVEKVV